MAASRTDFNNSANVSFDYTCTPCKKKDSDKEAVSYCVDCLEYFCSNCLESHNSFSVMTRHSLLGISEFLSAHGSQAGSTHSLLGKSKFVSGTTGTLPAVPTERCPKHPAEIVKMFCQKHDQVGCTVCMTVNHKSCKGLKYIPDVIEKLYKPKTASDVKAALIIANQNMKKMNDKYQNALAKLWDSKHKSCLNIQKTTSELIETINNLVIQANEELEILWQTADKELHLHKQVVNSAMQKLERCIFQLESAENKSQVFVSIKMSKQYLSEADKLCSHLLSTPIHTKITFTEDSPIIAHVKGIKKLGKLYCITQKCLTLPESKSTLQLLPKSNNDIRSLYTVEQSSTYNINITDDENISCNVEGSCVLDSGNLLLADYNNNKLKLFDMNKKTVTSFCTLPSAPTGVCSVSNVEAAASLTNNTIQFVSIGDQLLPTRSLTMYHSCYGLAISGESMYISDCGKSVYIYTLDGKLVKTINQDHLGQEIFSCSRHLTLSNNSTSIHIADWAKGLVTLDTEGQVIWKYSTSDLKRANSVCTDGCGNLFICGMLSHNVLQIGCEGKQLGELVMEQHSLKNPLSVCFDRNNLRLIVTLLGDNNILVFTLR